MNRYSEMRNNEGYHDPTAGAALRNVAARQIMRGDIYYISIPYSTGHEMMKDRPGIVVSCDEMNQNSTVVTVVMCSSTNREMPEHVTIRSTPEQSMALCEHIYTVDKSRIERFVGRCSKEEMAAVDIGIMLGLGLSHGDLARPENPAMEEAKTSNMGENESSVLELVKAKTERDTYKDLCESLLDRMTMERRIGA